MILCGINAYFSWKIFVVQKERHNCFVCLFVFAENYFCIKPPPLEVFVNGLLSSFEVLNTDYGECVHLLFGES